MKKLAKNKTRRMLKLWEKGYIVLPRKLLKRLFSEDPYERKIGFMFISLMCFCYHSDGHVKLNNKIHPCKKGEFIGTREQLSGITGIKLNSIGFYLQKLEEENLITVDKISNASRIRINQYSDFTLGKSQEEQSDESRNNISKEEAFARYLKAIQEGRYLSASDLDF